MLEGGAGIRFIAQLLGHARLETTQIYTEVTVTQIREVHARTHPHGRAQKMPGGRRRSPFPPPPRSATVGS
jgi:integrase/recombinase XerD